MVHAANAARWGTDWRPVLGLRPEDAGSMVERVLALVVMERAVSDHEEANKRAARASGG